MAIPAGLMPGGGAPMGAPMGAPGAAPPDGGGGGGIDQILGLLATLNKTPPKAGEDEAFGMLQAEITRLQSKLFPRSAKAAKLLAEANQKVVSAAEALKSEGSSPLPGPPDLTGGMGGMQGAQGPMGGM